MAKRGALEAYRAKRNFDVTPEPHGAEGEPGHRLIVQHHFATRDHYDLRLEIDGALASWAVTRGPSANPRDRRLAVRVEDHPLSYADFEGEIPQGEYGGGTVILWEFARYSPVNGDPAEAVRNGEIKFLAHGERMRGGWVLVRMKTKEKRENWLLIKERDAFAEDDDSLTSRFVKSVGSDRTREQIEAGAPSKARKKPPAAQPRPITHAERVVYADDGVTKGEIAAYYEAVAERIAPHLAERPVSIVRAPETIAETFFQRHPLRGMEAGVVPVDIDGETYMALDGAVGLHTAAQFGAIELHGWMSRTGSLDAPDRLVFDLDPDEGLGFAEVARAAADIAKALKEIGLNSWPMVSGGKGVHVIAPLDGQAPYAKTEPFAKAFAQALAAHDPKRFVATMSKQRRKGRIFVDWLRNKKTSTAILPWSLRARPGAKVATPVSWAELAKLNSAGAFDIKTALKRKDPWKAFFTTNQALPGG